MTKLQIHQYPKLIEEFASENFNLKGLIGILLILLLILSLTLVYFVKTGPLVITLAPNGQILKTTDKMTDADVSAVVKRYLTLRYSWSYSNINQNLKQAESLISPERVSSYKSAMIKTEQYVIQKKVTQRVYPRSVEVDLKNNEAHVVADRITIFNGLWAATKMQLVLKFTALSRTAQNPWGIFITDEEQEVMK